METTYTQIYHSPIGVIKIVASDYCIEELVFVEAEAVSKINLSEKINKLFNGKASFKNGEEKKNNSNILKSAFI